MEGAMDGEKITWTLCRICNKPVGLTFDAAVDEDGKAVHELCYVSKVTNQNGSNWQSVYNDAVAELDPTLLLRKIEAAQKALDDRLEDALHGRRPIDPNERQLIEDARHNLYFLKKHPAA
jgi:hypothetical protein